MKDPKMPSSIAKLMKELGFDPKAPKTTQIAFIKYIASQARHKKYGYTKEELTPKQNKKPQKLHQLSLFDDIKNNKESA